MKVPTVDNRQAEIWHQPEHCWKFIEIITIKIKLIEMKTFVEYLAISFVQCFNLDCLKIFFFTSQVVLKLQSVSSSHPH